MLAVFYSCTQAVSGDYKTTVIDKRVSEFALGIDQSTPLDTYLSIQHIMFSGKARLWHDISTYQFAGYMNPEAPDREVSQERKDAILNTVIKEVVVFKDSVAAVIDYNGSDSLYYISYSRLEDGKWVNTGQSLGESMEDVHKELPGYMDHSYSVLPLISRLKQVPQNIQPFVNYLRENGQAPKDFILSSLAENKIVVYGEYHRRKVSWDLLKDVIRDPRFAETTGTVFMELPSAMQPVMDQFFDKPEMDTELLLQIFREEQPHGWWDKGEFEFLTELWRLNKSPEPSGKIKVILADYQIPYSELKSKEEYEQCFEINRNLHMANVIEEYLKSSTDARSHLFIVGCLHAYKAHVPGAASFSKGNEVELTAGAQLAGRFQDGEVFTVFQHVVPTDNNGRVTKLIRDGVFDKSFEEAGNTPVAFNLKGSPFGAEPFDGISELAFNPVIGSYEDNFDGYIFMQPLKEEVNDCVLYEIFTDGFVEEIKRRAAYMGISEDREYWFATKVKDLTVERIRDVLSYSDKVKRYPEELFK